MDTFSGYISIPVFLPDFDPSITPIISAWLSTETRIHLIKGCLGEGVLSVMHEEIASEVLADIVKDLSYLKAQGLSQNTRPGILYWVYLRNLSMHRLLAMTPADPGFRSYMLQSSCGCL
jgi:hypothetical protein